MVSLFGLRWLRWYLTLSGLTLYMYEHFEHDSMANHFVLKVRSHNAVTVNLEVLIGQGI